MAERRVHIERLAVRLHGASEATGRQVANGLGPAVARALRDVPAVGRPTAPVEVGPVTPPRGADAAAIIGAVGRALAARLGAKRS